MAVADPVRDPLAGRTILVTRPEERAGGLVDLLRARGAEPLEAPTIRLEPVEPGGALDRSVSDGVLGEYAWVVFTSPKTVEVWFERSRALGLDDGAPASRVAAVGSGTAEALESRGVRPDLVPRAFTTKALGRAFPRGSGRVLLPRGDIAPDGLEETLRAKGWTPERVTAYRTVTPPALPAKPRRALDEGRVDAVVFTSASTVGGFVRLVGVVRGPRIVCIGPVTSRAARAAGFRVHAVASPHTVEGLVAALERALG